MLIPKISWPLCQQHRFGDAPKTQEALVASRNVQLTTVTLAAVSATSVTVTAPLPDRLPDRKNDGNPVRPVIVPACLQTFDHHPVAWLPSADPDPDP
ncbi:hypothetical protein MCOR25_006448 [Pyricularia grisea]|nr:hypothetical protein MCOR25_006448 [Pyricularia grisea]